MIKSRKASLIGISSVLLLAGALPAAAAPSPTFANTASAASMESAATPQSPNLTDTKIKRDEAVKLASNYLQIPDEYKVDNVSLQSRSDGENSQWYINFTKQVEDRFYGSYSFSVNAETGKLVSFEFHSNDPDVKPSYPPQTSLTQAKPIAEAFAKSVYPSEWTEVRYNTSIEDNFKTPLDGDVRYSLRYDRLVNGIPYPTDGFTVEVNGNGQVIGFNFSWDTTGKFEAVNNIISQEKALEIWKKESKLTTTYFKPYDLINKDSTFSIAQFLQPVQLEAATGKVWKGNIIEGDKKPLTTAPLGAAPKADQSLTKNQAIEAVASHFSIPANAKLEDASYNEYSNKGNKELQGSWNIRWSLPDTDAKKSEDTKTIFPPNARNIYAGVNAATGEVSNFSINKYSIYSSGPIDKNEYKITIEEAKAKAVDIVKEMVPYSTHQLILEYTDPTKLSTEQRDNRMNYSFSFIRVIDGILANDESVTVGIDGKTGDITNYNNSITTSAYPESKPTLIDATKAMDLWQAQYGLELQYVVNWGSISGGVAGISLEKYNVMVAAGEIPQNQLTEKTIRLVYVPIAKHQNINSLFIDAVTGEWKSSRTGEKVSLEKAEAADLEGHWAMRELQLMVEYNALNVKDGKVNPDQIATRGEMIKMLVLATNGGNMYNSYDSSRKASFSDVTPSNMYFAYVENAVDLNLIDRNPLGNFNPDVPMTREEMAELIVRALGYNSLAKKSNLFKLDVKDADSITHKGHSALVVGLGIMTSQDGLFLPKEEVSRAQAAVAFFRYLEQRGGLKDRSY